MQHLERQVVDLTCELIKRPSISPSDGGCQELLGDQLEKSGFHVEKMPFEDVSNLWARIGSDSPLVVFAGHTDVVPTGSLDLWHTDPFQPSIQNGDIYGRGAADMKGVSQLW